MSEHNRGNCYPLSPWFVLLMKRKCRYTLRIHLHDFAYYIESADQRTLTNLITHCLMLNFSTSDCLPFTDLECEYFTAVEAFCESAYFQDDDAEFLMMVMREHHIPPVESVIYAGNILYVFLVM